VLSFGSGMFGQGLFGWLPALGKGTKKASPWIGHAMSGLAAAVPIAYFVSKLMGSDLGFVDFLKEGGSALFEGDR